MPFTKVFTQGNLHMFVDLWVAGLISPLASQMDILNMQSEKLAKHFQIWSLKQIMLLSCLNAIT